MKLATVTLKSTARYSQSRPHCVPKLPKETADAHEARTWHERVHLNPDETQIIIPGMALRNCISEAAKFLSLQIPGKGKATYTKHFDSGILIANDIPLFTYGGEPVVPPSDLGKRKALALSIAKPKEDPEADEYETPINEVWGDWIFTPADGVAGSGKRVWKCYPIISQWVGTVEVAIIDDTITEDVFEQVLKQAGLLIGLGRFRVRNRGTYGRFAVESIQWANLR